MLQWPLFQGDGSPALLRRSSKQRSQVPPGEPPARPSSRYIARLTESTSKAAPETVTFIRTVGLPASQRSHLNPKIVLTARQSSKEAAQLSLTVVVVANFGARQQHEMAASCCASRG